jgi:hypothetical protein
MGVWAGTDVESLEHKLGRLQVILQGNQVPGIGSAGADGSRGVRVKEPVERRHEIAGAE